MDLYQVAKQKVQEDKKAGIIPQVKKTRKSYIDELLQTPEVKKTARLLVKSYPKKTQALEILNDLLEKNGMLKTRKIKGKETLQKVTLSKLNTIIPKTRKKKVS